MFFPFQFFSKFNFFRILPVQLKKTPFPRVTVFTHLHKGSFLKWTRILQIRIWRLSSIDLAAPPRAAATTVVIPATRDTGVDIPVGWAYREGIDSMGVWNTRKACSTVCYRGWGGAPWHDCTRRGAALLEKMQVNHTDLWDQLDLTHHYGTNAQLRKVIVRQEQKRKLVKIFATSLKENRTNGRGVRYQRRGKGPQ